MTRLNHLLVLVLGLLAATVSAAPPDSNQGGFNPFSRMAPQAETFGDSRDKVQVSARAMTERVAPGGDVPVAVVFDIAPGWHIWTDRRGSWPPGFATFDDAIFTEIAATAPEDGRLRPNTAFIQWPEVYASRADIGDGPADYASFHERAIAYLPVTVAEDAPPGPTSLALTVTFQTCDDTLCLGPVDLDLTIDFEVVAAGGATAADVDPDFAEFDPTVWPRIKSGDTGPDYLEFDLFGVISFSLDASTGVGLILIMLAAALGGFLLNLTPCVLPVIPIKIISLSQSAGNRKRTLYLGIVMTLGIIAFWLGLGVAIAAVASFTATNQLFQYPLFTITIGLFIAVMAVGMCGVFSLRLPRAVYSVSPKLESAPGSFMFGVMVAVLSTPCTAPFMGVAAAWAALQTAAVTLTAFAAIGIGMGLPYLVLAAFPDLVKKMPRTGPASEVIKQVMGLLMLAAAAYFVGIGVSGLLVTPPEPPSRTFFWFVAAFSLMAGAWLLYKTIRLTSSFGRRAIFGGLGVFVIAVSLFIGVRMTAKGPIDWVYYTHARFDEAKGEGSVVMMEFTAEWCLNCKALEQSVLRSPRIIEILDQRDVVPMKVDLTGNNSEGNEMLGEVNRLTIPLLVIFDADGQEVFKADFYTVDQVVEAIGGARGTRVAKK